MLESAGRIKALVTSAIYLRNTAVKIIVKL